jgi:hypothetical protein
MSANNGIYVLQVEWTYPRERTGQVVTKESTESHFFVFEGDVDMWGELASKGVVTKRLLWTLLMAPSVRKFEHRVFADNYAEILDSTCRTEYGILAPMVTYHSK